MVGTLRMPSTQERTQNTKEAPLWGGSCQLLHMGSGEKESVVQKSLLEAPQHGDGL